MKQATLVIAEHNEGTQLNESLDNLFEYNDSSLFNVIVVSDGSEVELDLDKYGDMVKHVKKPIREGVGAAVDTGAEHVETPQMIIMGSDIRFRDKGCVKRMVYHLWNEENAKSLICTTNLGINLTAGKTIHSDKLLKRYGAKTLFFMTAEDLPQKGSTMARLKDDKAVSNYRNILEAKWLPKWDEGDIYAIPCILGAFYGVRTDWYRHIMGFQGHRYWGTLEPFISTKSWFAGGDCKIAVDIETGHLFKQRPSHITRPYDLLYNKIAISRIIFGREMADKFIEFLGTNPDMDIARELTGFDRQKINTLHERFAQVKTRDIHWFNERWPFKHYDLVKNKKD